MKQSFSLVKLICTTLHHSLTSEELSILYENFKILRIDGWRFPRDIETVVTGRGHKIEATECCITFILNWHSSLCICYSGVFCKPDFLLLFTNC